MLEPNKLDKPLPNLLSGMFLVLFGTIASLLASVMWRSIDNWLFLTITFISFAIPSFTAFFLGLKKLSLFAKLYISEKNQNN